MSSEYRESFSQSYSVNRWELLFSRGGRAATVLGLLACSWITMKGFVFRGYPDTVGFGFENVLENTITGLETDLQEQLEWINRDMNEMQLRLDSHSESFRPMRFSSEAASLLQGK